MYPELLTIPLVLLGIATVVDLRRREVPNWIPAAILTWSVLASAFGWHGVGWIALLAGLLSGFTVGTIGFAVGGWGGGDVKLIAALGALLGPVALVIVLFWMAIAGALLALIVAARGQRSLAYVPAITAGFIGYLIYPAQWWKHFL